MCVDNSLDDSIRKPISPWKKNTIKFVCSACTAPSLAVTATTEKDIFVENVSDWRQRYDAKHFRNTREIFYWIRKSEKRFPLKKSKFHVHPIHILCDLERHYKWDSKRMTRAVIYVLTENKTKWFVVLLLRDAKSLM